MSVGGGQKPSRRDLLRVIGRLQTLVGQARAAAANDRHPDRAAETDRILTEAFETCLEARSHDPPEDA